MEVEESNKKFVVIFAVILVLAVIAGGYLYYQSTRPPQIITVRAVNDPEFILLDGDSYFCWHDVSDFEIVLPEKNDSEVTVVSSDDEICTASINEGILTCSSGIAGQAQITLTAGEITSTLTWIVDKAYISEEEKGITLMLPDGTIVHPGEENNRVTNNSGMVVLYDGEPVSDYKADNSGFGNHCLFKTYDGKLLYFTYNPWEPGRILTIEYNGERAQFKTNTTEKDYRIFMGLGGVTEPKPSYGDGFGNMGEHLGEFTLWDVYVFLDGEKTNDFEVKVSDESLGHVERTDPYYFRLYQHALGDNVLTISADGAERSYIWHCHKPYSIKPDYSRFFQPPEEIEELHIYK